MNRKQTVILGSLIIALLTGTTIYAAQDTNREHNDAVAIQQARISLPQAIAAAEKHTGGKASGAELEDENGKLVYGVEVVNGSKVTDVKVDIVTGKVLSAQADQADNDNEHEGDE